MEQAFIVDLEGVLIQRVSHPVVHPEAEELLKRARKDFSKTYLWTLAHIEDGYRILRENGLSKYFDNMIGRKIGRDGQNELMIGISQGSWNRRACYLPPNDISKDLRKLGDTKNLVLLEDTTILSSDQIKIVSKLFGFDADSFPEKYRIMRNGYPEDRIVRIESFTENYVPSLMNAYLEVLEKR